MELVFVQCCVVPRSRVLGCIATRSRGAASSCAAAGSSARAHARTHAHTRSNGYRLMVTGKLRLLNDVQGSKMNEWMHPLNFGCRVWVAAEVLCDLLGVPWYSFFLVARNSCLETKISKLKSSKTCYFDITSLLSYHGSNLNLGIISDSFCEEMRAIGGKTGQGCCPVTRV